MSSRIDPAQLDDLKARHKLSDVLRGICNVTLKGKGAVTWAKSPFNAEKTPSFKCDDRRGQFKCFSSGRAGDHIDAIMAIVGCDFLTAVELLGGVRPLSAEERRKIEEDQRRAKVEQERDAERARRSARDQFEAAAPIAGTHAEAYLAARGLVLEPGEGGDLRFFAGLRYRGFVDQDAEEETPLGAFPAMVAAIRDERGVIIGLHRTYLDPAEPRKLTPPGDLKRNKAKKILGKANGMIRLTALAPVLVMGEGIETTLSGHRLGVGGGQTALAAGVSLGNMAGRSTGRIPHPLFPDQPARGIPNGIPDPDEPGLLLPEEVETVYLLVDRDSDLHITWAQICVAAQRIADSGRAVMINEATPGMDHNNMWLARFREAA